MNVRPTRAALCGMLLLSALYQTGCSKKDSTSSAENTNAIRSGDRDRDHDDDDDGDDDDDHDKDHGRRHKKKRKGTGPLVTSILTTACHRIIDTGCLVLPDDAGILSTPDGGAGVDAGSAAMIFCTSRLRAQLEEIAEELAEQSGPPGGAELPN